MLWKHSKKPGQESKETVQTISDESELYISTRIWNVQEIKACEQCHPADLSASSLLCEDFLSPRWTSTVPKFEFCGHCFIATTE